MELYKAEAVELFTRFNELQRRRVSERKEREKKLPEVFTLDGRIRCQAGTLIQALCGDLNADMDNLSARDRLAVEKALEPVLRRYNVHPSWIPLIERVMDKKKIANWDKEKVK